MNLSETVYVYPAEEGRARAHPHLHAHGTSCRSQAIPSSGTAFFPLPLRSSSPEIVLETGKGSIPVRARA